MGSPAPLDEDDSVLLDGLAASWILHGSAGSGLLVQFLYVWLCAYMHGVAARSVLCCSKLAGSVAMTNLYGPNLRTLKSRSRFHRAILL